MCSQVAQDCLHRLDRAFKSFFGRIARYPRFKHDVISFTYPDAYDGSVAVTDGGNITKRLCQAYASHDLLHAQEESVI